MWKNKKAEDEGMGTIKALILFLSVTIILFGFIMIVVPFFQEASDKELCRLSVGAKYAGKKGTLDTSETPINLQCYTQTVTINEDGIYKRGRERENREIYGFPSGNSPDDIEEKEEMVKEAVANEMYDCWEQFWQGKLSIFTQKTRCVVCSRIIFTEDWAEGRETGIIENFGEYLNTKKIPGQKITYSDFFGGEFDPEFNIQTSQTTEIVFQAVSESWWNKIKSNVFVGCATGTITGTVFPGAGTISGATIGCSVGLIGGVAEATIDGSTWKPTLVMAPSSIATQECDQLY